MSEDNNGPKSITQQIFDKMLIFLEDDVNFSKEIIERIKNLANAGDLQKEKKVYDVLNDMRGDVR